MYLMSKVELKSNPLSEKLILIIKDQIAILAAI